MVGNSSFKVGLYIRLSRDDGNVESDSIVSQRSLLKQYVKENNYVVVDEYVDDGFSGTNFDRPAFKRMIKDIELGKINMIITKDMSRLGRDYIGTGELIEKYFPSNNIRYIAINDGIDTFIEIGPGKVLSGFVKKINSNVKIGQLNYEAPETWEHRCTACGKVYKRQKGNFRTHCSIS